MSRHKSDYGDVKALLQLLRHDFQMVRCDGYMALVKVHVRDQSKLLAKRERAVG